MSSGGTLALVTGASRSGKTHWTWQRTRRARHLLVWDSMLEFSEDFGCRKLTDPVQLHALATRPVAGRWAMVCPVTSENFDVFCRFAWVWVRMLAHQGERATLVVEELADVTSPGKAPPAWGEICRKSLRFDPEIYALTQRPAESDKTVMGNATLLHCHSMQRANDRRDMARELDVDQALIDGLDFARYEWIERDRRTRELRRGGKSQRVRPVLTAS